MTNGENWWTFHYSNPKWLLLHFSRVEAVKTDFGHTQTIPRLKINCGRREKARQGPRGTARSFYWGSVRWINANTCPDEPCFLGRIHSIIALERQGANTSGPERLSIWDKTSGSGSNVRIDLSNFSAEFSEFRLKLSPMQCNARAKYNSRLPRRPSNFPVSRGFWFLIPWLI